MQSPLPSALSAALASATSPQSQSGVPQPQSHSQSKTLPGSSFYSLTLSGQLESCLIPATDNIFCKYGFVQGQDWVVINGIEEGITQLGKAATSGTFSPDTDTSNAVVWNFPLEISWKSTNCFGWPQLVLAVYGLDLLGRDVVRGYGAIRIPRTPGQHTLYVPLFVPCASSKLNGFLSWVTGRLPEFLDSKFVSKGDGREAPQVSRVSSSGSAKVTVNVVMKDMEKFGYTVHSVKTPSRTIL